MKLFLLAFFITYALSGNATRIEGRNQEYAGKELQFYRYSDPVTLEKTEVFTLKADEDGYFNSQTEVHHATFVFCDFGVYRGMLFLEPEQTIRLLLPPWREKSFADQKNPYFEPVEFWFVTADGNRMTDHISVFDNRLNRLTDSLFNAIYFNRSKAAFDTLSKLLPQTPEHLSSATFRLHKKLKTKAVEADAFRLRPQKLAEEFSGIGQEYWTHPAFIQLFEKTFTNALTFETRSGMGNSIKQAVSAGDISYLIHLTEKNYSLSGPQACLALLKMLHDAYYSGEFSQDGILNLLGAEFFSKHPESGIRNIAGNILKKLQHLRKGTRAPVICLKNTNGEKVCSQKESDEKSGKYKYLIFADTEMIVCREQLKYLTRIEEQFSEYLDIIVVLKKTDLIEMKMFLDKQKIPGTHLIDEQNEYINQYRIKTFPECFLLNPRHEVVFQQTYAPLDGFELQFGTFLRKVLFENQRGSNRQTAE